MAAYPGQGGGGSSKSDLPIDIKALFFSPLLANPLFDITIRIPVIVFLVGCATYFAWGADGKGCGTTPITWAPQTWWHKGGCTLRGFGQTMPEGFQDIPPISAEGEAGADEATDLIEEGE